MWKKEDSKPQAVADNSPAHANSAPASSATPNTTQSAFGAVPVSSRAAACISQGIRIKGEVKGSVKADVTAREVIVRGKIEGKVTGRDKVQLLSTGEVTGEVLTDRLAIEDGALLRGKVEAGRQPSKAAEAKAVA